MSYKKLTIAQIIPSLNSGGVERGVIDISNFLQKQGFKAIIISSGGKMVEQIDDKNITFIKLDVKSKNPFKIIFNIRKLQKIIKEYKIDILHVRSRAPMISAYFACKNSATKLISTIHGPYSINKSKLKRFYNSFMLKSDHVIAVSNFIKDYIKNNYPKYFSIIKDNKLTVICRGVDLDYFNPQNISEERCQNLKKEWKIKDNKKPVIFMPGRFTFWKGHEFLIDALKNVKDDFLCIMAGSSHGHEEYKEKLMVKINNLNLNTKIKIVDNCKDMPAAYKICKFVISPSIIAEAFGRIAIESQACQKAIIATNIGGFLETIIDNKTGFFVDPQNTDHLQEKISLLLNYDQKSLEEIGKNGRENVINNFCNKKMCQIGRAHV